MDISGKNSVNTSIHETINQFVSSYGNRLYSDALLKVKTLFVDFISKLVSTGILSNTYVRMLNDRIDYFFPQSSGRNF